MRFLSALRQDFGDLFRWRPMARSRNLRAEIEKLSAGMEALQQYTNELEMRLNGETFNSLRLDRLEDQFVTLYQIQRDADAKQTGVTSQIVEFGNELEKLRLRLAVPEAEQKAEPPKSWSQQRRELEAKYAKTSVFEENNDAGKGKPS